MRQILEFECERLDDILGTYVELRALPTQSLLFHGTHLILLSLSLAQGTRYGTALFRNFSLSENHHIIHRSEFWWVLH